MFGTILKEVSGYFDRSALITAFFPSLIFWGSTFILVVGEEIGWNAAIEQWEGWKGTVQGITLIAFFAWVTFWSFLTINFRPFVVRLYEGYWSEVNRFVVALKEHKRSYWKKRWDRLDSLDRNFENQIAALIQVLTDGKKLEPPLNQTPSSSSFNFKQLIKQVKNCLTAAKQKFSGETQTNQKIDRTLEKLQQRKVELEERRERVNSELFRYYPTKRAEIMPTQLGNVLKAAEMYAGERYHLDAVLIWPRLLPNLPTEFLGSFSSAKVSLDLMVTLSAYVLLFGFPMAFWLAFKASDIIPGIVPLFLGMLAIAFQFNFLLIFLLLAGVLTIESQLLTLIEDSLPILRLFLPQIQVFLILQTSVLLAARLTYQNAVQAAVYYGEEIKTAFDLYRWKALEGMNLQLPPNLEEERKVWEQVCGLLYRSYPPDSNYYRYVKQTNTKEPTPKSSPLIPLPVPAKSLPAYRLIEIGDVRAKKLPEAQIPTDAVRHCNELIGLCPLHPLPADRPISRSVLVEQKYLVDTVAVGIKATPEMTLGGSLKAGDIIDIVFKSDRELPYTTLLTPIVWEKILILDVRFVSASDDYPFVVTIALPKTLKMEFATAISQTRCTLFKR